ncbi:MAG: hypothetical protein QXV37_02405 [Candidatus Jordarchaeaceae archaeon]
MENVNKIEHVIKGWEKKYGYIGINASERVFFAPLMGKPFKLTVLGEELKDRKYSSRYSRIYLGRKIFRKLKEGDVLICYKNSAGNYYIEKK